MEIEKDLNLWGIFRNADGSAATMGEIMGTGSQLRAVFNSIPAGTLFPNIEEGEEDEIENVGDWHFFAFFVYFINGLQLEMIFVIK